MLQKTLPFRFFSQVLVHDRNFNNLMPQKFVAAYKTKLKNEQSTKKKQ